MPYRRYNQVSAGRRQQGAALIVAMLVFALAAALVVAMKSDFNRFFERTANILLAEQAQAYLRGAEELAAMALIRDYDKDKANGLPRDDLTEDWAQPSPPFALENIGWMRGELEDLQGRFNINTLADRVPDSQAQTVRFTAAQEQFIRLLQALEEPLEALGKQPVGELEAIVITESVSDWLDADVEPSLDGAEDDYYYAQTPAYRAANRSMASVSELLAVANMTPEIYQALLPYITVWPETPGLLNIHTAKLPVLRSINASKDLSPLSEAEAQSLAGDGFQDINDFLANPVFAGKEDKMEPVRGLLGQSSSYFLLAAEVEVAGKNMRLYSVLERQNRSVGAIARSNGNL